MTADRPILAALAAAAIVLTAAAADVNNLEITLYQDTSSQAERDALCAQARAEWDAPDARCTVLPASEGVVDESGWSPAIESAAPDWARRG